MEEEARRQHLKEETRRKETRKEAWASGDQVEEEIIGQREAARLREEEQEVHAQAQVAEVAAFQQKEAGKEPEVVTAR